MGSVEDRELGLAELLQALGEELRIANGRAETNNVATLAWTEATVEVALEAKTMGKAGVKFAVLGIGAEAGADRGRGRTIRAQVRCVPGSKPNPRMDFGRAADTVSTVRPDIVGGDLGKIG